MSNIIAVEVPYDVVGAIIDYENGDLDFTDTVELFQVLVDTGLASQLNGHYGRAAANFIESGEVIRA